MKTSLILKISGSVLVLLLIIAVVGKKAGWIGQEPATDVVTEKAAIRTVTEVITANGKIQPETEVKISSDVSGEIVELLVEEGQAVVEGQLLLKIKPDTYQSAVSRAMAALNAAKSSHANSKARLSQAKSQFTQSKLAFDRNKKLWEQKTISQSDYETAQASFESARAEVEAADQNVKAAEYQITSAEASLRESQENLKKTTIFSPISGTISRLNVEKGERVVGTMQMTGTEMLRVANLQRMELMVEVNENDILKVSRNDTATIEIDAYLGKKFKGIVTEIANSSNSSATGTSEQVTNFEVKILLLESSYNELISKGQRFPFRPGMSATADIRTQTQTKVLTVPIQAVTTRPDSTQVKAPKENLEDANKEKDEAEVKTEDITPKTDAQSKETVFLLRDGKAQIAYVTTGIQDNEYIVIQGIKEGDEVITGPYRVLSKQLKQGDAVKKVEAKDLFKK
ncbi:MAG: hypothetical protein RIS47_382 [Bacteroidota bacterium]|jgi:HlyD family secretion protein